MAIKIKFLPYEKFKKNTLKKFLKDLEENTIILIDAKLEPAEEAHIIEETMMRVSEKFTGIELNSIDLSKSKAANNIDRIKFKLIEALSGKKRGITIIGPAKIVRQIKKNPEELLLYV